MVDVDDDASVGRALGGGAADDGGPSGAVADGVGFGFDAELSSISLARGVQATTAIEGNTLSTAEVLQVVREGTANVSESRQYLEREVSNILAALREIDAALRRGEHLPITRDRLCALNLRVLDGIPDKPEVIPGRLREQNVSAGPYLAPQWRDIPELVDEFVRWLPELRGPVNAQQTDAERFTSAMLTAIMAHLYIAWIHPFGNGNGRVARLVEVQILSESGVVPLVATNVLSDHYNKTRNAYYLALDDAQRDANVFVTYAIRGFLDELRLQIKTVRQLNLEVHWESFVYEVFNTRPSTEARARQRLLALTMPEGELITPEEATELTAQLARRYAKCGPRIPSRDLNDLVKMGLVEKTGHRHYRPRRERIEAFLPPASQAGD